MNSLPIVLALAAVVIGAGAWLFFLYKPQKSPRTDNLYTEALNAMVRMDKAKAVRLLRDVVKQDSDHVDAYLQLGNIIRVDNPQQAAKIHQTLTVRPNLSIELQVDIHQALALDYETLDNTVRARKEAEQILRLDKRNQWAVEFLLSLAEQEQDWDQAADRARQLQKLTGTQDPNELARYMVFKGLESMKQGQQDEARSFFEKAMKQAPELGLPYRYLGDVYAEARDLVKAVENWERFAELSPGDVSMVFSDIESALFDLGRYSEVENFYRRVLDKNPNNLEAVIKLANVLEEKGERQAALALVEESIEPDNVEVAALIMKLKLSLSVATPVELGHQIDEILQHLHASSNNET